VIGRGRPAAWNGTGHPLMARGGMGDVLTGFLTTFIAQGMPLYEAAALGSWVLGRGAELYHQATGWEEPGLASEVMLHAAGAAMAGLRAG
jgi:NAD(P)H-hydrate repair Nnr-like enzyme with NAD(P)H-hydrate dehydratase domain